MDNEQTEAQLNFLFNDGDVFEVCVLGSKISKHALWGNEFAGNKPIVGYFNDKQKAVKMIQSVDKQVKPAGIYITINPCKKELLARANNRLLPTKTRTSDVDIERIENFFIDLDPKRPAGISSSEDELYEALLMMYEIKEDLEGFGRIMTAMSGNGYHMIFKASGGTTSDIKDFLVNISDKFKSEKVDVDKTVFNPARLIKAYGTTARKGENLVDVGRIHRVAVIQEVTSA